MDDDKILTQDDLHEVASKGSMRSSEADLADKLTLIACRQLSTSSDYKKERMAKIKKYEELYQGKVPRKFRQLFSVPFPAFTSFVDTLESDFSDPITCTFIEQDPADYFKAKKIQASFNIERKSIKPSGMWDLKVRLDKKNAIMSGRGIQKYYASSDPEYESHFDVVDYNFFHCQPTGGAILENHLFCGEEGIRKTRKNLIDGVKAGIYNKDQVKKLISASSANDYEDRYSSDKETIFAKFRAIGLDPQSHSYIGEPTYSLAQWCLNYRGKRWYVLFDPYTKIWIRCEPLSDVYSGDYYPYTSWATHEDQRVFWSVGYSDFYYPISDSIITMVNQELTNREKSNFNARAYDESMFEDEAKLDEAQYRPDALVPVNTKNGVKKISDGIYRFDTPQLQGTIQLIDWVREQAGILGGGSAMTMGQAPKPGTKAFVQFQQQQQIEKRLSFKAQSYQECYQQLGLRFIQGLKDHMPASMAVRLVGPEGYDHWDEITRIDLTLERLPHIEIESVTAQENANKMKTDKQMAALTALRGSQNINQRVLDEYTLRKGGGFDDMDVAILMDTNSSADKEMQAKAAIAIKCIMEGMTPEVNYDADIAYMKLLKKFLTDHMPMLKRRELIGKLMEYMEQVAPIAEKNAQQQLQQKKLEIAQSQGSGGNAPAAKAPAKKPAQHVPAQKIRTPVAPAG